MATLSDTQNWLMMRHPGIFEKIMLMVGLDSLESLDICRQVCKTWNTMIMNQIPQEPQKSKVCRTNGQTDRQTDGRTDGLTDGRTDPLIEIQGRI